MRFAINANHRDFFYKNQYIEMEGILSLDQVAALKKNADTLLGARLRHPVEKLGQKSGTQLFQAGYDLWRDSDDIKKITHKNTFATIAYELFQILPLRYAFDQYIYTTQNSQSVFPQPLSLDELSCLRPLAGALILPLEDLKHPFPSFPLPLKAGSGLFITPSLPIPWPELFATPDLRLMIIGFGLDRTTFCPDTSDPHAVNLKKLGYVFNEHLKDSLHPVLLRR